MYIYRKHTHYLQFLTSLTHHDRHTSFIYQLNAHFSLVKTLNELLQHTSVHMYDLQGTMPIFLKTKCYCEAVIYKFLGQTKELINNSYAVAYGV